MIQLASASPGASMRQPFRRSTARLLLVFDEGSDAEVRQDSFRAGLGVSKVLKRPLTSCKEDVLRLYISMYNPEAMQVGQS